MPAAAMLATMLAAFGGPGAAFAQSCTGQCVLDKLLLPVTASAGNLKNSAGTSADREASPAFGSLAKRASTGSTPRWTVSVEAIGLGRFGGVNQALVERIPGTVPFFETSMVPGTEALNSNQFQGFSAGPKISLTYHDDSGYGMELSYFNIFDQTSTKAVGPDSPADWLVMTAPGTFWQTQDFAYQAMAWTSTTSLFSAEANGRMDVSSRVTMLAGFRWLQLNDKLLGTLTPADLTEPSWKQACPACNISGITAGGAASNYPPFWNTSTINNLYGVQFGVDAKLLELGRFSLEGLIKAGMFDNNAAQLTAVSMRKTLFPAQATTNQAAFAGEAALQLKYQVIDRLALKVGYRALWLAGVALAPGQIQETSTTQTSVRAFGVNSGSSVLFQGATAGFEYSF